MNLLEDLIAMPEVQSVLQSLAAQQVGRLVMDLEEDFGGPRLMRRCFNAMMTEVREALPSLARYEAATLTLSALLDGRRPANRSWKRRREPRPLEKSSCGCVGWPGAWEHDTATRQGWSFLSPRCALVRDLEAAGARLIPRTARLQSPFLSPMDVKS